MRKNTRFLSCPGMTWARGQIIEIPSNKCSRTETPPLAGQGRCRAGAGQGQGRCRSGSGEVQVRSDALRSGQVQVRVRAGAGQVRVRAGQVQSGQMHCGQIRCIGR